MMENDKKPTARTDSISTLSAKPSTIASQTLQEKSCTNYNGEYRKCISSSKHLVTFATTSSGKELQYEVSIATGLIEREARETSTGQIELPFERMTAVIGQYTEEAANYVGEDRDLVDIHGVESKIEWPDNSNIEFDYEEELDAYRPEQTREEAATELLEEAGKSVFDIVSSIIVPVRDIVIEIADFSLDIADATDLTTGKRFYYSVDRPYTFILKQGISFTVAPGSDPFPVSVTDTISLENAQTVSNSLEYTVHPSE